MSVFVSGYVDPEKLADEVERAKAKLGPEVVRVKHTVGLDTSDEAVDFRIVLADSASRFETLGDVARRIQKILRDDLRPNEQWGLRSYFSFRGESEQAKMTDRAWA